MCLFSVFYNKKASKVDIFGGGGARKIEKQGGFLVTKNSKQGVKMYIQKYLSALLYVHFLPCFALPSDEAQGHVKFALHLNFKQKSPFLGIRKGL